MPSSNPTQASAADRSFWDPKPGEERLALFAPAGDPAIGGGHIMRCLTLAHALGREGVRCSFIANSFGRRLIERFGASDIVVHEDDLDTVTRRNRYHFIVFDDYAVGADQEEHLKAGGTHVVVLDDLANRAHAADLLIDPSYGRRPIDYRALLPRTGRCLAGPEFALLRPAFAERRADALARPVSLSPRRVFLSFGLSDVGAIAERATALVRTRAPGVRIDVALASSARSAQPLKRLADADPGLTVHCDAADVADLIAAADLSIGAGGVSTWERCCLASPTLAVILADNQRPMIERLAADGAILKTDLNDPDFQRSFLNALDDAWRVQSRQALKNRSAALCDGLGAGRIAEAIVSL